MDAVTITLFCLVLTGLFSTASIYFMQKKIHFLEESIKSSEKETEIFRKLEAFYERTFKEEEL